MCEGEYDPQRKYENKKALIEGIAAVVLLIITVVAVSFIIPIPISIVKEQGVTYIRPIFTDYYEAIGCDESWLDITIPREIKGKPVKVITTIAFSNCKCIKKITLPDSIEIIEKNAFYHCESLDLLTIPKSVKKIHGRLDCLISGMTVAYEGNKEDFKRIIEPEELSKIEEFEYSLKCGSFYAFCRGENYERS